MMLLYLKPSIIHYSQQSINNQFSEESAHAGVKIGKTVDEICEGRCTITDIPTINVVRIDCSWYTTGNRRLWIFRWLERLGLCETIPAIVLPKAPAEDERFQTSTSRLDVQVRGDHGSKYLTRIALQKTQKVTKERVKKLKAANFNVYKY